MQVSLGVGAYRTDEGKPWILPCVKTAEKLLAERTERERMKAKMMARRIKMMVAHGLDNLIAIRNTFRCLINRIICLYDNNC